MANEDQQQGQQQGQQQQGVRMPEVNSNLAALDDYAYEMKPLPKRAFDQVGGASGQATQQGGMSSQFDVVSSALNKNI